MTAFSKDRLFKNLGTAMFGVIWIIVLASPTIAQNQSDSFNWELVWGSWIRLLPIIVLSGIHHFLLAPYLFFSRKRIAYFISLVLLIGFMMVAQDQIRIKTDNLFRQDARKEFRQNPSNHPGPDFGPPPGRESRGIEDSRNPRSFRRDQNPGALPPGITMLIVFCLILGFDLGMSTIFKWSKSEQERTKLEKEHLDSQLAFLRNQISPHFFMNTLNNIHSLIDIDTDEAKEAVIQLSKLMRHLLYDSEVELIPLQKELAFIQNFIELMRLRFTDKVSINFEVEPNIPECKIPPLLFTSYLENAFKHGISYQSDSFIDIKIASSKNQLHFSIKNSNPKTQQYSEASGIGLVNSKKRLDLLYGKNYQMEVLDLADAYIIHLTLPL